MKHINFFYTKNIIYNFCLLFKLIIYICFMIDFINALTKSINGKHTQESRRRAEICAECPLKEKRLYADFVNAEIIEVQGFVCTECSCPIATKVFATESKNICAKWSK